MKARWGILAGIGIGLGLLALGGIGSIRADTRYCEPGTICKGIPIGTPGVPGDWPTPQPTPTPACPRWTTIVVAGPLRDENRARCYYIVQPYEQCSGERRDPETVYTDCPQPSTQNPCVDENGNPLLSVGPDGITCGRLRHMRSF